MSVKVKNCFQVGLEKTFGTAVAFTRSIDLISESVGHDVGWVKPETASDRAYLYAQTGGKKIAGAVNCYLRPDNIGEILRAAFGYVKTTDPTEPDTKTYVHEFKGYDENDVLANLNSLTAQISREVGARKFAGMIVNGLTVECAASDVLTTVTVDAIMKHEEKAAIAEPTVALSAKKILSFPKYVIQLGDPLAAVHPDAFSFKLTNNVVPDNFVLDDAEIPRIEPRMREVTLTVDLYFADEMQYDDFLAGTLTKANLKVTGDLIESDKYESLEVDLPNLRYNTALAHVDRRERRVAGLELFALKDATAKYDVKITLTNEVANYDLPA